MHRQPLLQLLTRYAVAHPGEHAVIQRFERFVHEQPRCFERSLPSGHVTGSAWVVSADGQRVLLNHHKKLDMWMQFGGHADGDPDVYRVAVREAREETGLAALEPAAFGIFDLDIHPIPATTTEPAHHHYDVRFALRVTGDETVVVSDESHDVAWTTLDGVTRFTREPSILRMLDKWRRMTPRHD